MKNKNLKRRIIEISYKHGLSHLGSCLTAVDIIKEIYDTKNPDEKFVLSAGHSGLALYVVIEANGGRDAEEIFKHHGVHPDRCSLCSLDCSAGSLGQGLPVAVGMALANRKKSVFCLISDGECAEGSIWEAMNIVYRKNIKNLKVYLNMNMWAAYQSTQNYMLPNGIVCVKTDSNEFPFLKDQDAHYYTMTEADYKVSMELIS